MKGFFDKGVLGRHFLLPQQSTGSDNLFLKQAFSWSSQFQRVRVPDHHGRKHDNRQAGIALEK